MIGRSRDHNITLCKLKYVYKDVRKDVFVNRHEQSDVVEDRIHFLKKMEELKLYMVEFNKNNIMKPKIYPSDCTVEGENRWPDIVITHNECK